MHHLFPSEGAQYTAGTAETADTVRGGACADGRASHGVEPEEVDEGDKTIRTAVATGPVWEGLRVGRPNPFRPEVTQFIEFGRIRGAQIGIREFGSSTWALRQLNKLSELGLKPEQVAVEVNRELVARARRAEHPLRPGDAIELVTLVGGG